MNDSANRTERIIEELLEIVGATHVSSAPADVNAYGGLEPVVVVWPGSPPELARVLKVCQDNKVAVGTTGYGARATKHWPVSDGQVRLALDTRRMTNILDLDLTALTVHCQSGIQIQHLEEALRRQDLTLGPFPAEIQGSTLGGLLSAPSATAHSPQVGPLKDACLALVVALPDGTVVHTRVAPRRATGPDIARFFIGSRGGLGVIAAATLRVHRLPEHELVQGFAFEGLEQAADVARAALARGARPARMRALGPAQAAEELGSGERAEAVLLVVLSGPQALVEEERRQIYHLASKLGGSEIRASEAERWWARHSTWTPPEGPRVPRVGARVPYSRVLEALENLPETLGEHPVRIWAEEFTLQGCNLWLSCRELENGFVSLRTAMLNIGLDPIRFFYPPLMNELRKSLDPAGIMVVMEGEWSGS